MRVFLYEFVTGGGLLASGEVPTGSLLREGAAMVNALATDFCRLPRVGVDVMRDVRIRGNGPGNMHVVAHANEEAHTFENLAREAHWTVVIAPEISGNLVRRCETVENVGGRLLGPSMSAIRLASNKQQTVEFLGRLGVATPRGRLIPPGSPVPGEFRFPAVLKPIDGAGSLGIVRLASADDALAVPTEASARRMEQYCPGIAASVAYLCGGKRPVDLPPCRQLIDEACGFAYRGGRWPLTRELADRAVRLAGRAVERLPQLRGYLGVDVVLGSSPDGADDVVVEINPRLTTSYVGLSALCNDNLAQAMLAAAQGRDVELSFQCDSLELTADGRVGRQSARARFADE